MKQSYYLRKDFVWDFEVEEFGNYFIGGILNHNSGKSECGAEWAVCHATGLYPDWWDGVRHPGPTDGWAAGITNETTRDIIQNKLLGNIRTSFGTGFVPKDLIVGEPVTKMGIKDAIEMIYVRHVSGGISSIGLKSMEQGPSKFMGTERHWIWLDEEPERDGYQIFSECKMRTMTIPNGQVLVTYTPLNGMSELCLYLLETEDESIKVVFITWDDATHLDAEVKAEMERTMLPHEREARMLGKPVIKEGLIYPFMERDILVDPFPVPIFWPHVIGMDVARSGYYAAVLIAMDPRTDVAYIINEYKKDRASREEHAAAIRKWGEGIYIAIDPSSNQGEVDGTQTIKVLKGLGLNVHNATNAVEAGIQTVFDRYASGKLKVFRNLKEIEAERRLYQFKDGKVKKVRDHLCLAGSEEILVRGLGWIPIQDLIDLEGECWTPFGWFPFGNVHQTHRAARTIRAYLADGCTLTATPEHPVLESGFTPLDVTQCVWTMPFGGEHGSGNSWAEEAGFQRASLLSVREILQPGTGIDGTGVSAPRRVGIGEWSHSRGNARPPLGREYLEQLTRQSCFDGWARASEPASDTRAQGEDARRGEEGHRGGSRLAPIRSGPEVAFPSRERGAQECEADDFLRSLRSHVRGGACETAEAARECNQVLLPCLQDAGVPETEERFDVCGGSRDSDQEALRMVREPLPDQSPNRIETLRTFLHWQSITSKEEAGFQPVYNLTVPGAGCFLTRGGFIVSNCDAKRYGVQAIPHARPLNYFRQEWLRSRRGVSHGNGWRPGDARVGY